LHDSVFIKERLLFFGELVRVTGTERYAEGGAYHKQSERSFVHGECSRRRTISFRHLGAEKNGRLHSDYAQAVITCLNALTNDSISECLPIVNLMWFGRAGNKRPT